MMTGFSRREIAQSVSVGTMTPSLRRNCLIRVLPYAMRHSAQQKNRTNLSGFFSFLDSSDIGIFIPEFFQYLLQLVVPLSAEFQKLKDDINDKNNASNIEREIQNREKSK